MIFSKTRKSCFREIAKFRVREGPRANQETGKTASARVRGLQISKNINVNNQSVFEIFSFSIFGENL